MVTQYRVFLVNEPGTLRDFSELFAKTKTPIIAISQDARYDAAVVRVAVEDSDELSHAITQAGITSVKTEVLCMDVKESVHVIRDLADIFKKEKVNINTIYGSSLGNGFSRMILGVNDLPKAIELIQENKIFQHAYADK